MHKRENQLIKLIAWGPLIFIPILVIGIIFLIIKEHEDNLKETLNKIEQDLILTETKAIQSKIDSISDLVTYQNDILIEKMTNRIKDRVNSAYKVANSIVAANKNKKSDKEIQSLIISALRPLSWNNGESFIFILDFNGIFKLAPHYLSHKEGESIINFQDATGRYVIKEEIELVKRSKEGFLWDTFTKPSDQGNHYKQVVFVKGLGAYNWYMGSGEYLDTASKINNEELLNAIKKVSANTNKYVFVFDTSGNILLNQTTPQYENVHYSKIDNKTMRDAYADALKRMSNKSSDIITYSWINPSTKSIEKKYSYIKRIPKTDWIIGTGFYHSNIKNTAAKQTVKLYEDYHMRITYIISVGSLFVLLSMVFSFMTSRYVKSLFNQYRNSILRKSDELRILNKTLEEKVKIRTQELEESKQKLEHMATTDALTKVFNRYALMNSIENEMSRSKRYNNPLSILMFDIDHFKQINDNFGHDVGDDVLVAITKVVKSNLRDIDIIGRYGGEEFIIIFPSTTLESSVSVAQRIRQNIENFKFDTVNGITISLGLVEFDKIETQDKLFKRLDDLLYKSKKEGRNRLSY